VGLLAIYGWLVHNISHTRAEVEQLQLRVNELKSGNAELEVENAQLYQDFCQEAEWLQECQLSIQSLEAEDKLSVENIDKIIGVHK
jgi:DNA integrity scanning protein DisA with diadenylate cyclase activity